MQVPRFEKVVINMGVGDAVKDGRLRVPSLVTTSTGATAFHERWLRTVVYARLGSHEGVVGHQPHPEGVVLQFLQSFRPLGHPAAK
jgi:hypothetical protein